MKRIQLDITKAAQFLSEGAVKAYEPKVKAAQEALENGTCLVTTFWVGCICPALSHPNS